MACVQIDSNDGINRFALPGMILAHAIETISAPIELAIGITHCGSWGQRRGFANETLEVQPLIGEVGKNNRAVQYRVVAAPILMHAGARIEPQWSHIGDCPVAGPAHDDFSTAFLRTPLDPIDVITVDADLLQADLTTGDQFG